MLRRSLSRAVRLPTREPSLPIDGCIGLNDLTPEFVADIERLAPFGAGNPPLILAARDLTIRSHSTVGRSGDHAQITVQDQAGNKQKILWWRSGDLPTGRFDLAFTVRGSDYQGEQRLEIEWLDARPAEGVIQVTRPAVEIVDYRAEADPLARLRELEDVLIWREADSRVEGKTRRELSPAENLAIWTSPPSRAELRAALSAVDPQRIILFALDPGLDTLEGFGKRFAGLVKYALSNRGGEVTLPALAAATAQREITVRTGLDWLVARGQIAIVSQENGTIRLSQGTGQLLPDHAQLGDHLSAHLRETAAYRAFYRRADSARLLSE